MRNKFDAVHATHLVVGHHQIETMGVEKIEAGFGAGGGYRIEALLLENIFTSDQAVLVVIDHQNDGGVMRMKLKLTGFHLEGPSTKINRAVIRVSTYFHRLQNAQLLVLDIEETDGHAICAFSSTSISAWR